ncbi:hypothetical protein DIPPA_51521 [Diplonema papillatum]|nr:hypothetical protein DIPPA_51521 [Diplonema papillatum]
MSAARAAAIALAFAPLWDPAQGAAYEYVTIQDDRARCLDGSAYGFLICRGPGATGSGNWTIDISGGGWCYDEALCVARAGTALGSSKTWPAEAAQLPCHNPPGVTTVDFYYCDGASFTGAVDAPVRYGNSTLYFRGRHNLDLSLDELFRSYGLANADLLVVTGGSAGGLATYLHLDHIAARMPNTTRVVGNPRYGFFVDHGNDGYQSPNVTYPLQMKYVFNMQNSSYSLSPECQAEYGWQCIMAPVAWKFIQTPLFLYQSRFDMFQLRDELFLPCEEEQNASPPFKPSTCNATEAQSVKNWGKYTMDQLNITAQPQRFGGFVQACIIHGVSPTPINGKTSTEAFADWLDGKGPSWYVMLCGGSQVDGPCDNASVCAPYP